MKTKNIILLLALAIAPALRGAPALLQHFEQMDQVSQVSDTQAITTSSGSLLVVFVGLSNIGTGITVSSPGLAFQQDRLTAVYDVRFEMWSAPNVSAGVHNITVTCSQPEYIRWGIAEFSGVATNGHVVGANGGNGTSSSVTTGAVEATTADTLLVAGVRTDQDDTSHGSISAGNHFKLIWPWSTGEPNQKLMSEYRVVGPGTYSNGFTMQAGDGGGWCAGIVAFAPAGAGNGGGPHPTPEPTPTPPAAIPGPTPPLTIRDIQGLQEALDGKSDTGHKHDIPPAQTSGD